MRRWGAASTASTTRCSDPGCPGTGGTTSAPSSGVGLTSTSRAGQRENDGSLGGPEPVYGACTVARSRQTVVLIGRHAGGAVYPRPVGGVECVDTSRTAHGQG